MNALTLATPDLTTPATPDAKTTDAAPAAARFRALGEVCRTDHLLSRPILVAPDVWRLAVEPALPHHRAELRAWALAFAVYQRLLHVRRTLAPIACPVVVQDESGRSGQLRCSVRVRPDAVVVTLDGR